VKTAAEEGRLSLARLESFRKLQCELGKLATGRREHAYTINKRRAKQGSRPVPPDSLEHERDESGG
jgi:hypothetical protein